MYTSWTVEVRREGHTKNRSAEWKKFFQSVEKGGGCDGGAWWEEVGGGGEEAGKG